MRITLGLVMVMLCTFANADSVNVTLKNVPPQQQKNRMSCWMTGGAMVYGFKKNLSIDERGLSLSLGDPWKLYFDTDAGLAWNQVASFGSAIGLTYAPPANPTVNGWAGWLGKGPVWVAVIAPQGPHVWVLTAMVGDGTSDGTQVTYNDPSDGTAHKVSFGEFIRALEKYPRQAGADPLYPQILHLL